MAAPKIKKKSVANTKSSAMPNQAAIPCLVLLLIIFAIMAFFFFAGFHTS